MKTINTEINEVKKSNGKKIENKVKNTLEEDTKKSNKKNKRKAKEKQKSKVKKLIFLFLKILVGLIIFGVIFIYLFFKTSLFQKYKELWVATAMSTMNNQYFATWFLSEDEINEILNKLKVENNEDSNSEEINIGEQQENKDIKVEKVAGKNYVGYVMIIPDASKVKMVDSRKTSRGTKLSEIAKNNNAIAGINAGGFTDENRSRYGTSTL